MTERAQILTEQGLKLLEQQNFEGAIDRFQLLMELEGESAHALRNLGKVYWEAGQEINSYQSYWKAHALDRTDKAALIGLCRSLVALKRSTNAMAILERHLKEFGEDREINALLQFIANKT
jgi:Flp pilus assembly protein TadD